MAVVTVKKKQIEKEATCPNCEGRFSYKKRDAEIRYWGCEFVVCPECGEIILTTGERIMPPTFPRTFLHFGTDVGADAKVSDKDIQEMINKAVDNIKIAKVGEFYKIATGDTVVVALKHKDDIDIVVAKDYWKDTLTNED